MNIAVALQPRIVVLENVPQMNRTLIEDEHGAPVNIISYIGKRLGEEYEESSEVVEFADYGVPQRRQRLITIFTRDESLRKILRSKKSLLPRTTHSRNGAPGTRRWVTVRDTIGALPALDGKDAASATSPIPYHEVPVLDSKKYTWISHTPPERGAFDNQCSNDRCMYSDNPSHGSSHDEQGINRASEDTPLYCLKCGELLPRPYTIAKPDGSLKIMKGFTSAYKRMRWDLPASTITTNLQYPSSDHKLHPEQNRVLSLHEAFRLHTLDRYEFSWELSSGEPAPKGLTCQVMGESIPPKGLSKVLRGLLNPSNEFGETEVTPQPELKLA